MYRGCNLTITRRNQPLKRLVRSKAALALPVTFLILFVSTLGIISVTYYFSVEKISSQTQVFQVSTAKQSFVSLNNVILSTLGQPGSSASFVMPDCGGVTNIEPTNNTLTISINDTVSLNETIFNASIGQVTYDLPCADSVDSGFYLAGDSNTITNQSGSSLSQLYIPNNLMTPEIQLSYRLAVSYATGETENGQAVTDIRIYIVNLNSSDAIALGGALPLQISCTGTQLTTQTYQVSYQPQSLTITSQLNGVEGSVSVPIASTSQGSIINVETVISNISITRSIQ